ncbi:hypothetical protein [Ruegeria sp. EL01]|uniref:hypothetical protein n=1 Tax=Ruegeria sp. EL01 TaxID=2107578 RepID=UPI000EA81068|nr:hypothetical protein [Ruegeria sp. EL01]
MNLVICDVDEVVLQYFTYLKKQLNPAQFALEPDGFDLKIKDLNTGQWLEQEKSDQISDEILLKVVSTQEAISGAIRCLTQLSENYEIVFLTNVREEFLELRKDCLKRHGLPFCVVENVGGKGHSVSRIIQDIRPERVSVIDDSIRQLINIRKHVPDVDLVRAVLTTETQSTAENDQFHEASTWDQILNWIERA